MTAAVVLALVGCANPMLDIRGPGYSLPDSQPPVQEPQSMAEAMAKLNHMRAQYYQAIRDQTGQELGATQGIVWLGTVIAGMAVADVHRDALLVATGVGGTTYGLARTQLDPRRTLVWTAGMEALDCAKQAALPLDLGKDRTQALERAAALVRDRVGAVQLAQQQVTVRRDESPGSQNPAKRDAAGVLLQRSADVLVEVGRTQAAAAAVLHAARGSELSVTVDRVHTQVTRALRDIAVGLESIKALIAGLGGFAATLAPNAGVDSLVSKGLEDFKKKLGAQAGVLTPDLDTAMTSLETSLRQLVTAEAQLAGLTQGVDVVAVSTALKACKVASPATPLLLTPTSLQFEAAKGATKGFEIGGGTPPYMVVALDVLPDNLALQFAGGLSDTVQVKVGKDVAEGNYRLRVTDSGASKASRQLELRVGPASSGNAGGTDVDPKGSAQTGGATNAGSAWQKVAEAMLARSPVKGVNAVDVTLTKAEPSSTGIALTIRCAPAGTISSLLLKDRLTANLPETKTLAAQLGNDFAPITLTAADSSCVIKP